MYSAGTVADSLCGAGARATINCLWVIGWFGDFNKLSMTQRIMAEVFGTDISAGCDHVAYAGDPLNDEPMFHFFPYSAGVSTVVDFLPRMTSPPRW